MSKHKHAITTKSGNRASNACVDAASGNAERIGVRVRRLLFFWVSLCAFLSTLAGVIAAYCWIMTWPAAGEAGFAVIFGIFMLSQLAMFGVVVSLVLCGFAIPHYRGAIALFVVESAAFVYVFIVLLVFYTGIELGLLPVWN